MHFLYNNSQAEIIYTDNVILAKNNRMNEKNL